MKRRSSEMAAFFCSRKLEILPLSVTLFISIPHSKAIANACCGISITIVANFHEQFFFSLMRNSETSTLASLAPKNSQKFKVISPFIRLNE